MSSSAMVLVVGLCACTCALGTWCPLKFDQVPSLALIWSLLSMVSSLFPLQIALLSAVLLGAALRFGTPLSGSGSAGVLLGLAGIIGLLAFIARQFAVRRVLSRELGQLDAGIRSTAQEQRHIWRIWRPLHCRIDGIERIRNLAYGDAGVRNLLDIYRPRAAPGRGQLLPVMLQVHGSGWMVGSKDHQALPLIYLMASRGWLVVSINYRLSPAARFPAHLIDVKKAIAWVRTNISQYGGDGRFIAITGGSAGGHLATLAALTSERRDLQPGFDAADTSVSAAVPLYGRYDFLCRDEPLRRRQLLIRMLGRFIMPGSAEAYPELWQLASPVAQVNSDAPAFFIIQGSHDSLVPVQGARIFSERLRAISQTPVVYAELKGLQHAFDVVQSPATEFTIHAIHRFLDLQYQLFLRRQAATSPCPGEIHEPLYRSATPAAAMPLSLGARARQ